MNFSKITVGILEVNCYLVFSEKTSTLYIIDPGGDAEQIVQTAGKYNYQKAVVLLTHAHFDHISGLGDLVKLMDIEFIFVHKNDVKLYKSKNNHLMPYAPPAKNLPEITSDASLIDKEIKIYETPGHTAGGVCYYFKEFSTLFSGDTLFAGSVGRTDFPGGNPTQLIESIKNNLLTLPDNTEVYPGHGPSSSIAREKQQNPYL